MAKAKGSENYKIVKKKNGRYMVRARGGETVNGLEKTKILLDKGLIKTGLPKEKSEEGESAEQ